MRRVVITGYGVLSPIGHDADQCAESLRAMRGGIHPMPEWDHIADLQTRIGGKVTGIDLVAHFPRRRRRTQGTVGLYSMFATDQAIAQAGRSGANLPHGPTGDAARAATGRSRVGTRPPISPVRRCGGWCGRGVCCRPTPASTW